MQKASIRIYPKMTIIMAMAGCPPIKLCSFGLSSAPTAFFTSYSDGALQKLRIINGMDDDDRYPPWSGGPIMLIMLTTATHSLPTHK